MGSWMEFMWHIVLWGRVREDQKWCRFRLPYILDDKPHPPILYLWLTRNRIQLKLPHAPTNQTTNNYCLALARVYLIWPTLWRGQRRASARCLVFLASRAPWSSHALRLYSQLPRVLCHCPSGLACRVVHFCSRWWWISQILTWFLGAAVTTGVNPPPRYPPCLFTRLRDGGCLEIWILFVQWGHALVLSCPITRKTFWFNKGRKGKILSN
jgi:hypothetical protein